MTKEFTCRDCGKRFTLAPSILARYPNWTPGQCLACRKGGPATSEPGLAPAEALSRFHGGPDTGVFTDGCCEGNPGPGGWGAVKVISGEIVEERRGRHPDTTNNRMELQALIEGYKMLQEDDELPVFSDSDLCVKTINTWAAAWAQNGWKRGKKREEVKNLDLVKELFSLAESRPNATLQWIKAHEGFRWNEYADALSRAYQQEGT